MTSKIKVDNINKVSDDSNIIKKCGTTITLGASGDSIALASGATQTGFGRTGTVDWQTGSIKTGTFTAANGEGYFVNTSGGVSTANLPAGSAGAIVSFSDYTRTFLTNNLTISPNGSEKIGGIAEDLILSVNGQALTLIYVDATEGWINVQNAEDTETGTPPFITACGGTKTVSGSCTIHTFTGPGTFTVNNTALCAANNEISYMVVAGGGAGGDGGTTESGGGAGAGGFREDKSPVTPYTASPLDGAGPITVSAQGYPITVGGRGSPTCSSPSGGNGSSGAGSNSVFSTITSAGGGGGLSGGASAARTPTNAGGSGGGGNGRAHPSGSCGNTPPVSPAQGTNGGAGAPGGPGGYAGGGGGGATAAGSNGSGPNGGKGQGGNGGAGATTSINATPTAFAGGGGGGARDNAPAPSAGTGGTGGGGRGGVGSGSVEAVTNGTANTGGGAGGSGGPNTNGGAGGSGIVIIRYKSS